jgi:hypothetical protein
MQESESTTNVKSHWLLGWVSLLVSGPLFMSLTDPRELPLPLIVVPFLWLFVSIYVSIQLLFRLRFPAAPRKRRVIVAGTAAALPVLLAVFASLHQLTVKDFLLAVALVTCISFYMARADFIN